MTERWTPEWLKAVLPYLQVIPTRFLASAGHYGGRTRRKPLGLSDGKTPREKAACEEAPYVALSVARWTQLLS